MNQTQQLQLSVQPRSLQGRKIKQLRSQGILPGNVYGNMIESQSVQVDAKQFLKLYAEAGETQVINLQIDGSKTTHPVLVSGIQLDPASDTPIHVDFRQVNLREKINATVPLELIGEAPAVDLDGIIIQQVSEIEVEALPMELPESIEIDISVLTEIDQVIMLKDLPVDREKISIELDPETILVKVEAPMTEEEAADAVIDPDAVEITGEKPDDQAADSDTAEEA